MAKKRMFSTSIVEDDVFLDMPASSQNLYFHLCMNADDDGFVSPRKIIRMCSATQDDLSVLILRRYVLVFTSGIAVIKHWHKNNSIKKDRYIATTYQKELSQLTFNEWNVYTEKRNSQTSLLDVNKNTTVNRGEITPQALNGAQMEPQVRLDKVSVVKNSISISTTKVVAEKPPVKTASKDINEMFDYWEKTIGYKIQSKITKNRWACSNLLKKHGKLVVEKLVLGVAEAHRDQFSSRAGAISDFKDLQSNLNELIAWGKKRGSSNSVEVI